MKSLGSMDIMVRSGLSQWDALLWTFLQVGLCWDQVVMSYEPFSGGKDLYSLPFATK